MKNSFSVLISVHLLKCSLSRHNGIIAPNTKFFFFSFGVSEGFETCPAQDKGPLSSSSKKDPPKKKDMMFGIYKRQHKHGDKVSTHLNLFLQTLRKGQLPQMALLYKVTVYSFPSTLFFLGFHPCL